MEEKVVQPLFAGAILSIVFGSFILPVFLDWFGLGATLAAIALAVAISVLAHNRETQNGAVVFVLSLIGAVGAHYFLGSFV